MHLTPNGREQLAAAETTTDRVMAGLPAPLSAGDRRNLHGLLARFLEHTAGTE
jgi:DNA-binding MarR family transcriptional regulator